MKELICILTLLFSIGCGQTPQNEVGQDDINQTSKNIQFDFELLGEVNDKLKSVTSIQIRRKGEASVYQILGDFTSEVQENEEIILEDLNFDGYPDIRLLQYLPSDSNIPFFYWLYEPTTAQFVRNMELEKVTSPAIDRENKYLLSQWTKSQTHVGTDFYRYKGNQLVLVRQEIQEYIDESQYTLTIKEPIGDSMQVVKTEVIQEDDVIF